MRRNVEVLSYDDVPASFGVSKRAGSAGGELDVSSVGEADAPKAKSSSDDISVSIAMACCLSFTSTSFAIIFVSVEADSTRVMGATKFSCEDFSSRSFLGTTFQSSTFSVVVDAADIFTVSAVVVFVDEVVGGLSVKILHLLNSTPMLDNVSLKCSLRLIYDIKQNQC